MIDGNGETIFMQLTPTQLGNGFDDDDEATPMVFCNNMHDILQDYPTHLILRFQMINQLTTIFV